MKFIEEKTLRDKWWKHYDYRNNILNYQFECNARTGGVDLLTIETVEAPEGLKVIFIGWEFKLDDIKKAIAQAEANLKFCHKSFIVIPIEKQNVIEDKYLSYLKEKKYIGVVGVELTGKWKIIFQPQIQRDGYVKLNQEILKLACKIL